MPIIKMHWWLMIQIQGDLALGRRELPRLGQKKTNNHEKNTHLQSTVLNTSNNTSPKAAMETESIHISPISGNLSNINVFEDTAQNSSFMSKNSIYNETTLQEDDTTIIGGTPALLHDEPVSPTMDR